MAVIWKYNVEPSEKEQEITVPLGARLISAIEQDGKIVVYALVEEQNRETQTKRIYVVGTGWDFAMDNVFITNHVGTVKTGVFVWHVLEVNDIPF